MKQQQLKNQQNAGERAKTVAVAATLIVSLLFTAGTSTGKTAGGKQFATPPALATASFSHGAVPTVAETDEITESPRHYRLNVKATLEYNDGVGDNWSHSWRVNGISVQGGERFALVPGQRLVLQTEYCEHDMQPGGQPDIGKALFDGEMTADRLQQSFTITQQVLVREDDGTNAGATAEYEVEYCFTMEDVPK